MRRLNRDGEGEYRLNGARCRLVDVIEVLSDSGLGKEMHSVVSQGKVEQIVLSRPRERRLLIEEAAGLGKHRKRRRRAQLKLERTEDNLGRALDVEREARSRLRPLKRQAEAAELHERLERQTLEARYALARDATREARAALAGAEQRARAARSERDEAERLLGEVAQRREQAEQAFAAQTREREQIQAGLFSARSAAERIAMRLERVREQGQAATERGARRERELELLEADAARHAASDTDALPDERLPRPPEEDGGSTRAAWESLGPADRIRSLEREIGRLETDRQARLRDEIESLDSELERARGEHTRLQEAAAERQSALEAAEAEMEIARTARREAERAVEAARARAAKAGADLAVVNQFLRTAAAAPDGSATLAQSLDVAEGYELALAAALGPRLSAAVVDSVAEGERLLDGAGEKGGTALMAAGGSRPRTPAGDWPAGQGAAVRLLEHVTPTPAVAALAERLLGRVWVVDSLSGLPDDFSGVAVTRSGRWLDCATGELSQAPAGGAERVLEERRRRDELITASEAAAAEEADAGRAAEQAGESIARADAARDEADAAHRRAAREVAEAAEAVSRTEWVIARRREAPDEGPGAVRRAELIADLRAERRLAERIEAERAERTRSLERVRTGIGRDAELARVAERAAAALERAQAAVATRRDALAEELTAARRRGRADRRGAAGLRPRGGRAAGPPEGRQRGRHRSRGRGPAGARHRGRGRARPDRSRVRAGTRRRAGEPSPCPKRSARPSRSAWIASTAAASSSGRSTRSPSRSTTRPWPTSRSWRSSAGTSRRRWPSWRA